MCARLLTCPLCSQPGFLTLDALRAGLVSVATRPLACPVCNEVLLGIDKLTIHLFSHSINQNVNETKIIDMSCTMLRNVQNIPLQTWNLLKNKTREENGTEQQKNLEKTTGQVIFVQNQELRKEEQHERTQDFGGKPMIFIQGKEPLRIENTDKQPNLIFIQEKEPGKESDPSQELIFVSKDQVSNQKDLSQMVFVQQKNQKEQESATNQVIFLQNSEQVFPQNLNFCPEPVSRSSVIQGDPLTAPTETIDSSDKVWQENQTQFPVVINLADEENSKEAEPSTQNINSEEVQKVPKKPTERCDICGFHFPDKNILMLHKQVVHVPEDKEEKSSTTENLFRNYPCFLCTKVFKMRGSLMVHMRVAHTGGNSSQCSRSKGSDSPNANENGYNCPTCGKNFKKEQHVTQHLKTHEGKQWECDVCSKMFTTKYFLKKHKRLHSGEMPYKCTICDKTFTFQQSYHKHRLYHKDDKPHTCNICGRSFKELSTLHNHERIHTGEKPFACETCGKCFRQRVSYLVHRRIHTGVMPYKCTACGKSFRYKVSQRTHKCPVQQPVVQPAESTKTPPVEGTSQEATSLDLDIEDSNKYVLIVNEQGEPVLTRQSEVDTARTNEPVESNVEPETPDFYSMMSPLGNDLSSPSTEMEHLRLSSPDVQTIPEINDDIINQTGYTTTTTVLQTINEESLKELLYGISQ